MLGMPSSTLVDLARREHSASAATFEAVGVERDAAGLGDLDLDLADAGGEGLWLVPVAMAPAILGAFMMGGPDGGVPLGLHGDAQEPAEGGSDGIGPVFGDEFHDGVQRGRIGRAGHSGALRCSDQEALMTRLFQTVKSRETPATAAISPRRNLQTSRYTPVLNQ